MGFIFDIIAVPLGYVLSFIYNILPNYFVAIFLFTLVVRAATFPLSLKSQKSQAERAKLAPRLERIQKKYAQDRQKMALKQQELYEKEGVSMTGGCLPMIVQMIILFGIISVIYMPLKHLAHMPDTVINASVDAMQNPLMEDGKTEDTSAGKLPRGRFTGYYKELYMMKNLETYKTDVLANIEKVAPGESQKYYDEMIELRSQFDFFGRTLLDNPFEGGFKGINILWLIPLFSGLTALASSIISMHYTKMSMGAQQPGQGCSNTMMLVMMPAFSLFITFTVPGGVGIYWICSNIIAVIQTIILNKIYNPGKIRAQAEAEYEERRRKKAEDKKRLAEARKKEEEDRVKAEKEAAAAAEKARQDAAAARKKPVAASKNPNKIKRREGAGGSDDQPAEETLSGEEEKEELPAEEAPVQAGPEEPQDVANERESAEETEPEDRKEN